MNKIKTFLGGNRMKSFYWRTGMMIVAVLVSSLLASLDIFAEFLSPAVVTFIGLMLGEVSKAINTALKAKN